MQEVRPFFSIIIPTYNASSTLATAIDSILSQTFTSFEIIIMDGESSDTTVQIAKSFLNLDHSISITSQSDDGIYDAMNNGIKKARGLYFYFLGADDYLIDTKVLADIHQQLILNRTDVIYGNVQSPSLGSNYMGECDDQLIFHKNIAHQSIFFHRRVFELTGYFNLKYRTHADWAHNINWFFNSEITNQYFNRVIAHYADGGYSSRTKDHYFRKDLFSIYYLNAINRNSKLKVIFNITKGLFSRITR
ncbi:glycosyltransferase [Nonlabens ulvanivorans]|uniref:Glycosyltransferase n=1 Tax=Nonlabens ulvanivorans TaxID=906888 RepID=A0A090WHY4_NONUL|nr:glycosyltransferase family 2 protein [Nonlabens ulvanivorans]GAL76685.1 glycosyltransferase [Nonlabens ulvanivorans]